MDGFFPNQRLRSWLDLILEVFSNLNDSMILSVFHN